MFDVTNSERSPTMTKPEGRPALSAVKDLLAANPDGLREIVPALAIETHENWLEAHRYLNMNDLRELKKTHLRQAA